MQVKERVGALVHRERCAESADGSCGHKTGPDGEQEKDEVDDAEHEADLQQALTDQTEVARLVVDKWFVDKGIGCEVRGAHVRH